MLQINQQTPPKSSIHFFKNIKESSHYDDIYKIFYEILRREDKASLLSALKPGDESGKTLFTKIIKKMKKTNESRKSLNPLSQSLIYFPSFRGANQSLTNSKDTSFDSDISPDELKRLLENLIIKKSKQKYKHLIQAFDLIGPLPKELSDSWSPAEIENLFKPSNLKPSNEHSDSINRLNEITDEVLNNSPRGSIEGQKLLEKAIQKNYPKIVEYLLKVGIEVQRPVNHLAEDFFSIARNVSELKALPNLDIMKALYKARNVVCSKYLYDVIFRVLQAYLPPINEVNQKKNHALLDHAMSNLLGVKIDIQKLLEDRTLYIGHVFQLKENKTPTAAPMTEGHKLEGYDPKSYFCLHLRLFFQRIIELMQSGIDIPEEHIKEFLCELETGWLINQYCTWLSSDWERSKSAQSADFNKIRDEFINQVLTDYVIRQIKSVAESSEYVLYTSLPHHTIYVAFKKIGGNEIEIRVDNLGGFSAEGENIYHRHIANVAIDSTELRSYVNLLLNTTKECYLKLFKDFDQKYQNTDRDLYKYVWQVYDIDRNKKLFKPLQKPNEYRNFEVQKAGNCTHYSFLVGLCIRLNDPVGQLFFDLTPALEKASKVFNPDISGTIAPVASEPSLLEKTVSYSDFLKRKLLNRYLTLEALSSSVPFMSHRVLIDQVLPLLLFSKGKSSRLAIMGDAGMGKTIFSQQLAYQLQKSSELGTVVFYLPLRRLLDLTKKTSKNFQLLDLVETCILNRQLSTIEKSFVQSIIDDPRTVWILDGFDELIISDHLKEPIKALFGRQKLIVTSRPHFSIETEEEIKKVVDLETFKTFTIGDYVIEEKEKLVDYYFNHLSGPTELKEKLKSILKHPESDTRNHPNAYLQKICKAPISLVKVCQLLASGQDQIFKETNIAAINETFIASLALNAYRRKKEPAFDSAAVVKATYERSITYMEKLAFQSLINERRSHFTTDVKNKVLPEDAKYRDAVERDLKELGLVQIDSGGGQFVHASYQEYFAACYIIKSLKYQNFTEKFKAVQNFIEKKRYLKEYDHVFFCVAQIFQNKIEHAEKIDKKKQHIDSLILFLNLYFLNVDSTKAFNPSVSLISTIYDISRTTEELNAFVKDNINPTIMRMLENVGFGGLVSNYTDLQKLISGNSDLKDVLKLSGFVNETLNEVKEALKKTPPPSGSVSYYLQSTNLYKKITWTMNFISIFDIEIQIISITDLLQLCEDSFLNKEVFTILKALHLTRIDQGVELSQVKRLYSSAFQSNELENNFSLLLSIEEKIEQADLCGSLTDFIKTNRNNIRHRFKALTKFSICYLAEVAKKNNIIKLKIMNTLFETLFSCYLFAYKPSTLALPQEGLLSYKDYFKEEPSQEYEMLKKLQKDYTVDSHQEIFSELQPIFNFWDTLILKKDVKLILNFTRIDTATKILKSPLKLISFSLDSESAEILKEKVLNLARISNVSNMKNCPNRYENWLSIGRFLGDKEVIRLMDAVDPAHVNSIIDKLVYMFCQPRHGNSQVTCEIGIAIKLYQRVYDSSNQIDNNRINIIRNNVSSYTQTTSIQPQQQQIDSSISSQPTQQQTSFQVVAPFLNLNPFDCDFEFDFSYYGYPETLLQLSFLDSGWFQRLSSVRQQSLQDRLQGLKNELVSLAEGEISKIDSGLQREALKEHISFIQGLLKKLNSVTSS